MSTRLFVGNLPEIITENELKDAFSQYGQIVNVDLKNKPGSENDQKKFAFVTISASNYEVESCIKHFSNEDLGGCRLYVTRARESFLERLQRERQETQRKEEEKDQYVELPKKNPVLKLGDKLNPRKRHTETSNDISNKPLNVIRPYENKNKRNILDVDIVENEDQNKAKKNKKQQDSDKKRIESIKKKRQEFKEKQMIIKTGLVGIDKTQNKKVIFTDDEEDISVMSKPLNVKENKINSLFDNDESGDDDVNFEIKKQFEGKNGQKVLDLQSRFKSDKRFILDERFMEGGQSEAEEEINDNDDKIDLGHTDEKTQQLNILQDVLGVSIRSHTQKHDSQKTKPKFGMLRFDPMQPDHAKFLAPIEKTKQEPTKKSKKRKTIENQEKQIVENKRIEEQSKVEVSKEQFYKVSDTLKEALEQPATFSLRSLFVQNEDNVNDAREQDADYLPLRKPKEPKVKNPLDPTEKNPFVFDSSDSETEEVEATKDILTQIPEETESKAVWKENLFFSKLDKRLQDGLAFFNKSTENEVQKERRELKSVMKKRIYNKERKTQMFQKKIGGRKKPVKKAYKKT